MPVRRNRALPVPSDSHDLIQPSLVRTRAGAALMVSAMVAAGLAAALVAAPSASADAHTVTFSDAGGPYTFTVPAGITSLTVHAVGGSGAASASGDLGGAGADVQADFTVTAGSVYYVHVAGNGATYGDGANGGGSSPRAGGGGGASDLRAASDDLASRVLVAAGGGGGGSFAAGGAAATAGVNDLEGYCVGGTQAQPATSSAGGAGGVGCGGYVSGTDGSLGSGGTAGDNPAGNTAGGGGGGGLYGGGGGNAYGGGGGGSSYVADTTTNATTGLATYGASPFVQITYTRLAQTPVAFTSTAPSAATMDGTYTVTTSAATSGSPVVLSADAISAGSCTTADHGDGTALVTFTGAGTCVIDANQAGDATYSDAPQAQQSFAVAMGAQRIHFTTSVPRPGLVGNQYKVTATGGKSGSPVTFSADEASNGACTVTAAGAVRFRHRGTCVIDAAQAGTANYTAAPTAKQRVNVARRTQTMTFPRPHAMTPGQRDQALHATASSGLPVHYTTSTPRTCKIVRGKLHAVHPGWCSVTARQPGNTTYQPAAPRSRRIHI